MNCSSGRCGVVSPLTIAHKVFHVIRRGKHREEIAARNAAFVHDALSLLSKIESYFDDADLDEDCGVWQVTLPHAFRLEIVALFYVTLWEAAGITAAMRLDIPPIQTVIGDLHRRVVTDTDSFFDDEHLPELFEQVLRLTGGLVPSAEFDSDFMVLNVTADVLVESIAQLIWAVRRKLPTRPSCNATQRDRQ